MSKAKPHTLRLRGDFALSWQDEGIPMIQIICPHNAVFIHSGHGDVYYRIISAGLGEGEYIIPQWSASDPNLFERVG